MNAAALADLRSAVTPKRGRRALILDAVVAIGSQGDYDAVQMREVAERADIAIGTLYRYFPSKVHLLVSALGREFERFDTGYDWAASGATAQQRLRRLIDRVNEEWQRNPGLTEAMTRAFVFADASAAAEVDHAANVFEGMRAVLMHGDFRPGLLANAVLLNGLYLGLGTLAYLYSFRVARQRGLLLQVGE